MAQRRKTARRNGRPRILGPSVSTTGLSVAPSLPPVPPGDEPQVSSPIPALPTRKWTARPPEGHPDRSWWLPEDSEVRTTALQILAMRINGMEDEEIASALGISKKSVSPYVYRATKNGWLDITYNPKERLQYQTLHKVVERLEEGLDSRTTLNTGMKERTAVALEIAKGTVFKSFGEQAPAQAAATMVAIRIEMPSGPVQQVREDTTGGTPGYLDADVV